MIIGSLDRLEPISAQAPTAGWSESNLTYQIGHLDKMGTTILFRFSYTFQRVLKTIIFDGLWGM